MMVTREQFETAIGRLTNVGIIAPFGASSYGETVKAYVAQLETENARLREENAKLSALYGKRTDTEIE